MFIYYDIVVLLLFGLNTFELQSCYINSLVVVLI